MCQECVPAENFPLDMTYLGFSNEFMVIDMIETYYKAGAPEKARALAEQLADELLYSTEFFVVYYDYARREFEACYNSLSYLADIADVYGDEELGTSIRERFNAILDIEG